MIRPRQTGRPVWVNALLLGLAAIVLATLTGLGIWQLQRLSWKLDLIAAVESRAYGAPVAPPVGAVTAEEDAYRRVVIAGAYRHDASIRVKAITELGPGHWILAPLSTEAGHIWINRGFAPTGSDAAAWLKPEGSVSVEGLLRITEPGGTLLESNDPARDRWVSRDIAALSEHTGLSDAMPYFIDADHVAAPDAWPRGGLTIVTFRNPHLSYALTWFTMAALFLGAMVYVIYSKKNAPDEEPSLQN
ncbi:MAG: SURF1 family protein [Pseudomonadota bacterium]